MAQSHRYSTHSRLEVLLIEGASAVLTPTESLVVPGSQYTSMGVWVNMGDSSRARGPVLYIPKSGGSVASRWPYEFG